MFRVNPLPRLAEDSLNTSSLIFSEKQSKSTVELQWLEH